MQRLKRVSVIDIGIRLKRACKLRVIVYIDDPTSSSLSALGRVTTPSRRNRGYFRFEISLLTRQASPGSSTSLVRKDHSGHPVRNPRTRNLIRPDRSCRAVNAHTQADPSRNNQINCVLSAFGVLSFTRKAVIFFLPQIQAMMIGKTRFSREP